MDLFGNRLLPSWTVVLVLETWNIIKQHKQDCPFWIVAHARQFMFTFIWRHWHQLQPRPRLSVLLGKQLLTKYQLGTLMHIYIYILHIYIYIYIYIYTRCLFMKFWWQLLGIVATYCNQDSFFPLHIQRVQHRLVAKSNRSPAHRGTQIHPHHKNWWHFNRRLGQSPRLPGTANGFAQV